MTIALQSCKHGYSIVVVYRGKNVERSADSSNWAGGNRRQKKVKISTARRVGNINMELMAKYYIKPPAI
jgi:hypothetical protein